MIKRPVLRYHGGKWMLGPWIISHFPDHTIYVEAYGGAASVLLQKKKVYAEVYNDLDADIVNLFRMVRDHGQELKELLYNTPFSREEFKLSYCYSEDNLEQARRTVVRAFMGFASGSATKTTYGESSVGFRVKGNYSGDYGYKPITSFRNNNRGGYPPSMDWKNYPDALDAIIERLRGVVIESKEALSVIKQHDTENTLHYLDPPYLKDTRHQGQKTKEYHHEMTDHDHEEMCKEIINLKGFTILSGYENDLYNDLLPGWHKEYRNALADGAKKRTEVLWISPNTPICKQTNLFTQTNKS